MPESLRAYVRRSFVQRASARPLWSALTYTLPRWPVIVALAALPALVLYLLVVADPAGIGGQATSRDAVEATFARFISGLITAATIASSVAALTLGRELKGIQGQRDHHRQNEAFRARVRTVSGRKTVPLALGPFLAVQLDALAASAASARARASSQELALEAEGTALGELLDAVEERARHAAGRAERACRPHAVLQVALDFEQELVHHLARRFSREDPVSGTMRAALEELAERIEDVTVTTHYAKTLDIQWTLSRMSSAVLASSFVAILAAAATVLLYPEDLPQRAGLAGAGLVLALTLAFAMLPVATTVGFLLRVVFVNQNTLPSADFILGPEQPAVAEGRVPKRAGTGRAG